MSHELGNSKRSRGRPKGTGINDRDTLESISMLLLDDTDLKPTTAIRLVGVTDPSIVRRLRDKLKSTTAETTAAPTLTLKSGAKVKQLSIDASNSVGTRRRGNPAPATRRQRPPLLQDVCESKHREAAQRLTTDETAAQPGSTSAPAEILSAPHAATTDIGHQTAEPRAPMPDPQAEALRLAADAAGAMSRLYFHCMNFAAQTNPLSLALRNQNVMSEWMLGLINAHVTAKPKSDDGDT